MKSSRLQRVLRSDGRTLAEDLLSSSSLHPRFFGHSGFPEATDALAYDPVQRLLAVGTTDGRVKVFGRDGVERTFISPCQCATKHLQFLDGRGALLRVTQEGDVQLWGVEAAALLDSMPSGDDLITAVEALAKEPYLLLGCASGDIQVAALMGSSNAPALGAREACTLSQMPHTISTEDIGIARGAVAVLAAHSLGDQHRLLIVHEDSGAVIWDLRYQCVVAYAHNSFRVASEEGNSHSAAAGRDAESGEECPNDPTMAACWVGPQGDCIATGHQSGTVRVWGLPESATREAPPEMPEQAVLYAELRVALDGEPAAPVRALRHVSGGKSGGQSGLLVLGGQDAEQPDVLSMLPLQSPSEEAEGARALPWFGAVQGFALVPPEGSFGSGGSGEMAALIVLSEGGQLMVHDLRTLQPVPLSLPFQELPPVTASAFAPSEPPVGEDANHFPHAVSLAALCAARGAAHSAADSPESRGVSRRWRWVLSGGRPAVLPPPMVPPSGSPGDDDDVQPQILEMQPAAGPPPLYFTGHRDGRVRVWDMAGEVPGLLATAPFDAGGAGGKLRAVCAMEVCAVSGLLVVAHDKGEVRVYQFSPDAQNVTCLHIDHSSKGPPEKSVAKQPAGYQAVLKATLHEAAVTAACIASKAGLVALGDASGDLSVLNLCRPSVEFYKHLSDQPIATAAFGLHSFMPTKTSSERRRGEPSSEAPVEARLSLYVGTADCALTVLDVRHGEPLGIGRDTWLRPKHADSALGLTLLDAAGCPLRAPAGPGLLPWAGNTRAAAAAAAPVKGAPAPPVRPAPAGALSAPAEDSLTASSKSNATEHHHREAQPSTTAATAIRPSESSTAPGPPNARDDGHIGHLVAGGHPPRLRPAVEAGRGPGGTAPGSPGPGTPQRRQEHGGSVKGASDSEPESSENEAEDDHDDLLAAAAAAVDAQQRESVKAGKKKFGLLGRGSGAANKAPAPRSSEDEQGHLVMSHTAKSGLGRWVRRASENSPGLSPRNSAAAKDKDRSEAASPQINTKRSTDLDSRGGSSPKIAAPKEAPAMPAAPTGAPQAPQAESAVPLAAAAVVMAAPAPAPAAEEEATPPEAVHEVTSAAAALSVSDETPASAPVAAASVSHIVLASSGSLRLYAGDNLRTADRTTLKKAGLDGQYGFAGAFSSCHGPGIACISPDGILKVFSLPGLELVLAQRLEEALTFPWAWNADAMQLSRLCAVDPDGQVALVGGHGDLARVGMVQGTPPPAPPAQLYDWDLATAALAAAHAVSRELKAAAFPPPPSFQPAPQPPLPDGRAGSEDLGGKRGLGGFLHSVRDVATRVVDDTTKEISKFERTLNQGLDRFGKDILAARNPFTNERAAQRRPPTLAAVFANAPQPNSPGLSHEQPFHSGMDRKGSDELEGAQHRSLAAAKGPRSLPQHSDSADASHAELFGSGGHRAYGRAAEAGPSSEPGSWAQREEARDDGGRAELLRGARGARGSGGGAPALGGGPPGTRTAEEIKAAYGRSTNSRRAEGLGGLAEDNRQKLAERGEKLRTLQDKTDRMQADAEDFASMARRIRDREANKKWWQL
ncbi:hypothetical protein WJX75_009693 [Coccomyxa subellipsoidea]|uniref:V-SNARE coiled-coil homology domain-containing protein n=1 Tax=Coccomyxa subellipsoidea TaxID=248742 RepID=A0ABR2YP27_9CHLO